MVQHFILEETWYVVLSIFFSNILVRLIVSEAIIELKYAIEEWFESSYLVSGKLIAIIIKLALCFPGIVLYDTSLQNTLDVG